MEYANADHAEHIEEHGPLGRVSCFLLGLIQWSRHDRDHIVGKNLCKVSKEVLSEFVLDIT